MLTVQAVFSKRSPHQSYHVHRAKTNSLIGVIMTDEPLRHYSFWPVPHARLSIGDLFWTQAAIVKLMDGETP